MLHISWLAGSKLLLPRAHAGVRRACEYAMKRPRSCGHVGRRRCSLLVVFVECQHGPWRPGKGARVAVGALRGSCTRWQRVRACDVDGARPAVHADGHIFRVFEWVVAGDTICDVIMIMGRDESRVLTGCRCWSQDAAVQSGPGGRPPVWCGRFSWVGGTNGERIVCSFLLRRWAAALIVDLCVVDCVVRRLRCSLWARLGRSGYMWLPRAGAAPQLLCDITV